jgi:hypothetical protein
MRLYVSYALVQPAGIVHNELECSDDIEAVHETRVVERLPEAATAAH